LKDKQKQTVSAVMELMVRWARKTLRFSTKSSVIPALGRMRRENQEFKVSLGYILRPYLKRCRRIKSSKPT
jgi:hypothetical protein